MKIALLTSDGRDILQEYDRTRPAFGTAPGALLEGFARLPDVEVHVVACTRQPVSSPAKLADNIHFHALHVPRIGWLRTGYQGCIRAVRRKLREIGPDIVHGQGTERDCAISAVFSGYPNVVTVHGKMTEIARLTHARLGSFYWCAGHLENFTLRRTGGVICISTYIENLVRRYGVPLWPIPNALQDMFFDFPRAREERAVPQLINVGVISERKRQRQLLQLLRELREEGLDFETIFVGSPREKGPYVPRFLEELASARAALGKFTHVPYLENAEFCRLFDTSSAMVHFSSEESFGLVVAESLARNLPLFASDVGDVQAICAGILNTKIFPLHDWDGLKKALREWLGTAAFKTAKPAASPAVLRERYHPVAVAQKHLQVYREVLKTAAG